MKELLEDALHTKQETDKVDFKEYLDVETKGEWLEIIKDIVAMANSGGGILLIGVQDNGQPSGVDVTPILTFDTAKIGDKIAANTGQHFYDFTIEEAQKDGHTIAALLIGPVSIPLVFTKPGNYQIGNGKQKTAFTPGTLYFRHGAKSDPGTSEDLRQFLQREVEKVKDFWLKGIRKVVEAPEGSEVIIRMAEVLPQHAQLQGPVRIENDNPNAPSVREEDLLDGTFDYKALNQALKERYEDFVANKDYHAIRKSLEQDMKYCHERLLNPRNPKSSKTRFYRPAIFEEFDKHYTRKQKEGEENL
jgi:hypothetical protein